MDSYEIKQFKRLRHAQKNVPAWVNLFMSPVAPVPIMFLLFFFGVAIGMAIQKGSYLNPSVLESVLMVIGVLGYAVLQVIAYRKLDVKKHQYRD